MKTLQKLTILATALFFVAISSNVNAQSVGIGEREFTPHPSAILEIQSTTQGVLIPRVTFTQRMHIQTNAQAAGLLVFQVDRDEVGFHYFDGLVWRFLEPNISSELPNLAQVAFTGSWYDLSNRPDIASLPSLAQVALTGSWNDLQNRPSIPTHLRDLQQDNIFYMTVNRQQIQRWDDVANAQLFSGRWQDLQDRPNFHNVATSGSWNDLQDRPNIADIPNLSDVAFSGNWSDLHGTPTIPTHLRELQQDNIFYMTVNRQQIERWDASAQRTIPRHLRDLEQDNLFYMTVNREQIERWNNAANASQFSGSWHDLTNRPHFATVATSGNFSDLTGRPNIPSALEDLMQNSSFRTVTDVQIASWDNKSNFSGSWNDLTNRPNFATVAISGNYNDLHGRPTIPTSLAQLQSDQFNQRVSAQDMLRWDGKSTFSGSWMDLRDRPNLHNVATSGDFNHLQNTPVFPPAAMSGSFNDLINVPEWGAWNDVSQLQIGTARQPQDGGSMNRFARADHTHTIENNVPIQSVGTRNQTIASTEFVHRALADQIRIGIAESIHSTEAGDVISSFDAGSNNFRLRIRRNVTLTGNPRLEQRPEGRPNAATSNYIATTACIAQELAAFRTEINALLVAERLAAEQRASPIGTIVMVHSTAERSNFNTNCWAEVTELRGRFPIGAGMPAGTNEFRTDVTAGAARSVGVGQSVDNASQHGQAFNRMTYEQMPRHSHVIYYDMGNVASGSATGRAGSVGRTYRHPQNHREGRTLHSGGTGTADAGGIGESQNNRPPFYGVYFMRRIAHGC